MYDFFQAKVKPKNINVSEMTKTMKRINDLVTNSLLNI